MARTKYKLGTFVKTFETDDTAAVYGAVVEVRLTTDGTYYRLTSSNEVVREDEIEQGFRPIVTRTVKARATKPTKATKKTRAVDATQAA